MPAYEYTTAVITHGLMGRKREEIDREELQTVLNQHGAEGWRSSDSQPGRVVEYADPELKCWMPLPSAGRGSLPSPWEGDEVLDGSGI